MNSVDHMIVEWFNSDFGLNFSNGIVGNLLLIFVSLSLTLVLSGLIGFEREYYGHAAGLLSMASRPGITPILVLPQPQFQETQLD